MIAALHIWFNILGPIHIVVFILQTGFHVGMYIFKTLLFLIYYESNLFFTLFIFGISVQFIFNSVSVNFVSQIQ
jgi:hypothetical protein